MDFFRFLVYGDISYGQLLSLPPLFRSDLW